MSARCVRWLSAGLTLASLAACDGGSGNSTPLETEPTAMDAATPAPSTTVEACSVASPGESPLRRLSNFEYQNTLADLTGDSALAERVSAGMVREPTSLGFRNSASALTIPSLVADGYVQRALDVAHAALDIPSWFPCDLQALDAACLQQFVQDLGLRAYRRPLEREELERFSGIYSESITREGDYRKAVEWVVASMLSSSHFLFRVELAGANDVRRPTGYEMASRLSYLLWQTMPDAELFAAAAAGELDSDAGVSAQVRRMMGHERAFRVYEFFEQWLDLDELSSGSRKSEVYPEYDNALRQRFAAEGRTFIYDLLSHGGTLEDLFAAPYTMADQALARHYGLDETAVGDTFQKIQAPGRSGILTQAGLLVHDHAASTSMVRRGLKIRTDILCQTIDAPPANVDISPPVIDGTLTQRQRLNLHRTEDSCASCHALLDPVGALFDGFDALGRPRTVDEAGAAIELGGEVVATQDINGTYGTVPELGRALARSEQVRACVVRQAFRFFYGREMVAADHCAEEQIQRGFAEHGYRLDDLILSLTQSDQFLYRKADAVTAEETP